MARRSSARSIAENDFWTGVSHAIGGSKSQLRWTPPRRRRQLAGEAYVDGGIYARNDWGVGNDGFVRVDLDGPRTHKSWRSSGWQGERRFRQGEVSLADGSGVLLR